MHHLVTRTLAFAFAIGLPLAAAAQPALAAQQQTHPAHKATATSMKHTKAPTTAAYPTITYRAGSWNAEFGRHPADVRAYLSQMVTTQNLDFVALQEFKDYVPYLTHHPIPGYRITGYVPESTRQGGAQTPILVRTTLPVTSSGIVNMGGNGWTTVTGGHMAPVVSGTITIASRLRVLSIHAPVAMHWAGGHITGPASRIDDYRAHSEKVVSIAHKDRGHIRVSHAHRFATGGSDHAFVTYRVTVAPDATPTHKGAVFIGDWNATKTDAGPYSPQWVRAHGNLAMTLPPQNGPGFKGIDWVLHT